MSSEETAKAKESTSVINGENETKKRECRERKRFLPIILIVAAMAAIVGVVLLIIHLNSGAPDKTVFDTDAIFLPENDSSDAKYALFKNTGERLTDFEYTSVGEFVNGYATVRNSDGKNAIIDHAGKLSVGFDEYEDIRAYVGFYEVKTSKEDESKKLILGNGQEIASDYKNVVYDYSAPFLAVETEDNHYSLYNSKGDRLAELEGEQPFIDAYNAETVSYARYEKGIYLLDNKKQSIITNYETERKFNIESVSKDSSAIILRERAGKDSDHYAVYRNGKVSDYDDKCKEITLNADQSIGRLYLTCRTDDKSYLIRGDEVSDIVANSYDSEYRVYDEDHYIKFNSDDKKATFFVKGEQKDTIDSSFAPTVSLKGYYVRNSVDRKVSLYGIDGQKIYTLDETSYGDLAGLDKNENIIVRDPNQSANEKYSLVNSKGEVRVDKLSELRNYGEYYVAKKSDQKTVALLDKDGNEIISGDYRDFSFYNEYKIVFARTSSDEYVYIDLNNKTEKDHYDGYVYYNERSNTLKVSSDKKVTYLTASGDKIYEYEK